RFSAGLLCAYLCLLCVSALKGFSSASEDHPYVPEGGEQSAARKDIFETGAGDQRADATGNYDVVGQQWTILHAHTRIESYRMTDVTLEEQGFQDFGAIKFGPVRIDCGAEFGRDFGLKRCVEEQD